MVHMLLLVHVVAEKLKRMARIVPHGAVWGVGGSVEVSDQMCGCKDDGCLHDINIIINNDRID